MRANKGKFIGKSFKAYHPGASAKKKLEKVQSAEFLPYIQPTRDLKDTKGNENENTEAVERNTEDIGKLPIMDNHQSLKLLKFFIDDKLREEDF